jgi:hypothetical protein
MYQFCSSGIRMTKPGPEIGWDWFYQKPGKLENQLTTDQILVFENIEPETGFH